MVQSASAYAACDIRNTAVWLPPPFPRQGSRNNNMHVVASDFHIPKHDVYVVSEFMKFIEAEQPRMIHLLGDILDFVELSRFRYDPGSVPTPQEELDLTHDVIAEMRERCPTTAILYSLGNHELRLDAYLFARAKHLYSLRNLMLPELLRLEEIQVGWYPLHAKPYKIGQLHLMHGDAVRKHSGVSARANLDSIQGNVITGHTHRMGVVYRATPTRTLVALENGCMCDLSQVTYATCPDWQTGWTVFYDYGQSFHFEQVLINRGQYGFQGKQLGEACEQDSLRAPDPVAMSLV